VLADFLVKCLGPAPVVLLGFGLMLGGPVALLWWFIYLVAKGTKGARDGLVFGLGVASWASACWLIVAYCGGYPCLPGLAVWMLMGMPDDGWLQEVVIHGVNFTLWPSLGWLVFYIREAFRRAK
jgi:hypothetical protein